MRVVLRVHGAPFWLRQAQAGLATPELSCQEKFRGLLNAALATPYYSDRARTEILLNATELPDLRLTPLRDLFERRDAFTSPKASPRRAAFQPPFPSREIVVCGTKLALPRAARQIDDLSFAQLHLSQTSMLAATPPYLRRICAAIEARALALPGLCDAIVVLGSLRDGMLLPGERDMLWRCFGVPVFEQWLGLDGELLAWECEAHSDLHFNPANLVIEQVDGNLVVTSWFAHTTPVFRLATGWRAELHTSTCPCGQFGPILAGLETLRPVDAGYAMAVGVG